MNRHANELCERNVSETTVCLYIERADDNFSNFIHFKDLNAIYTVIHFNDTLHYPYEIYVCDMIMMLEWFFFT